MEGRGRRVGRFFFVVGLINVKNGGWFLCVFSVFVGLRFLDIFYLNIFSYREICMILGVGEIGVVFTKLKLFLFYF